MIFYIKFDIFGFLVEIKFDFFFFFFLICLFLSYMLTTFGYHNIR